jgi:prepilin-type N-terminal cleavage/methylation domain-containing protein
MKPRKQHAFTLIELLVVISVISLLLAIMLPCLHFAREQGRRIRCMANLRDIGHQIYLYSQNFDDKLIPGDWVISWHVWAAAVEFPPGIPRPEVSDYHYQRVNLGHLLRDIDLPTSKNHVFFCPSAHAPDGSNSYEGFKQGWGIAGGYAPISYMFNNSLDGFYDILEEGYTAVMSHKDKINFLRGDGSVDRFHDKRLVYDDFYGPQLLSEVCSTYGLCFPQVLLHRWLERGSVDLAEAKHFLNTCAGWNGDKPVPFRPVKLSDIGKKSIVCDVVGAWGGVGIPDPAT